MTEPSPPPGRPRRTPHAGRDAEVRAARSRLAQGATLAPEFEHELLAMFVRNELSARVTLPLLAVLFSLACMFWAPVVQASAWLVLVIGVKFLMIRACRRFQARPAAEVDVGSWQRRFVRIELASGLVWGCMSLIQSDTNDASLHVFILTALVVLLAIRMTFASTVLPLMLAGTVPMTAAVAIRFVSLGHPFYFAMAALAIGLHIYFFYLATMLRSTAVSMLAFRSEKDGLIAELEESKSISDEARRRAEGANVSKSRFLATMSHELRTPLNAILGFSEVMKTELLGPIQNASYREYAGNIHDSGKHLLHLINEILDLSRIEAGRYELTEEPVRLSAIVQDCHRLLKLRAESKGLTLVLELASPLPQLWADERALRQICLNLMSNALKFTPRGGRVTVSVKAAVDGGQMLVVRDTGPGIPKDEIPKVMQAFGQGSLAHQNAEGGTGLGLSIVNSLVGLHGGTFELLSELRKGTAAIVALPRARVLQTVPPLQPLARSATARAMRWRRLRPRPPPCARRANARRALRRLRSNAARVAKTAPCVRKPRGCSVSGTDPGEFGLGAKVRDASHCRRGGNPGGVENQSVWRPPIPARLNR